MKLDSFANKAYTEIRRKILSGQLLPNIRLKEDAWAQKIEVGRMAVREALTRLLGEGLLVQGERGGYFVASLKEADIQQIRELRQILEIGALELLIDKISQEEIDTLNKICDDFTNMTSQGYFAGACEADIKFHEALIEFSKNEKLVQIYKFSHIPLFHRKLGKTELFLNDYKETDIEHRKIVEYIASKNLDEAKSILKSHFNRGAIAVLEF